MRKKNYGRSSPRNLVFGRASDVRGGMEMTATFKTILITVWRPPLLNPLLGTDANHAMQTYRGR